MSDTLEQPQATVPVKKVDLGLDKVGNTTEDELKALRKLIDAKGAAATEVSLEESGSLMDDLKNEAMKGFAEDLVELDITEVAEFNQEYGDALDATIKEIIKDKIISSEELKFIETFMTTPKNFTKLQKAIDDKTAEQKVPATIDKFMGVLKSIGIDLGAAGKMTGETIAKNIAWIGGLLGLKTLCGIKCEEKGEAKIAKAPEANEDFKKMGVSELLASASKTGTSGEPARKYLSELFPAKDFGRLNKTESGKIIFVNPKDGEDNIFTLEKSVTGFLIERVGQSGDGKIIDGSQTAFFSAINELNQPDDRAA